MCEITVDGQSWQVCERVKRIVLWLLRRADELDRVHQIDVKLSCAGQSIRARIVHLEKVN